MFVRNESYHGRLERKHFPIGSVRKVSKDVLAAVQHLVSRGALSVHASDPSKPEKKPRTRKAASKSGK